LGSFTLKKNSFSREKERREKDRKRSEIKKDEQDP